MRSPTGKELHTTVLIHHSLVAMIKMGILYSLVSGSEKDNFSPVGVCDKSGLTVTIPDDCSFIHSFIHLLFEEAKLCFEIH